MRVNNKFYARIETRVRKLVKKLRDHGFNTTCSCGHNKTIEMEWYADEQFTELYNFLVERGYKNFVLKGSWDTIANRKTIEVILDVKINAKCNELKKLVSDV